MKLKYLLKEYFTYSASEKKGIFFLLVLILLFFLLPFLFHKQANLFLVQDQLRQQELDRLLSEIVNKKEVPDKGILKGELFRFDPNTASQSQLCSLGFSQFQARNIIKYRSKGATYRNKQDLLRVYGLSEKDLSRYDSVIEFPKSTKYYKRPVVRTEKVLFPFDPNVIGVNEWKSLGVSTSVANRIRKYIASGASFKSASDLEKIYGLDSGLLKKLYPFVKIENAQPIENKRELQLIDLNKEDSIGLKQLAGIGAVLSKRIIKYRNLLGGFSSKEQLIEVYGISKEKFDRVSDRLTVDSAVIQKMEINSIDSENLRKHPYVDYRTAKDIIRYRERNGAFSSLDQLRKNRLMPDSAFLKLQPYLKLN